MRTYWAANPSMVFQLNAFTTRDVIVSSWGIGDLSTSFRNVGGTQTFHCNPNELTPHLKNIGAITNDEARELLNTCGYASATIKEVGKSRAYGGYLHITFSVDDYDRAYTYTIWINGAFISSASQEAYDEETEKVTEFHWMRAIDYLRGKGYNLDFKSGEFIDITPKAEAYGTL